MNLSLLRFALVALVSGALFLPAAGCAATQADPTAPTASPLSVRVTVPSTVGDGTAFLCTVRAASLHTATVRFLKYTATAAPTPDGDGEITLLLPVPLDHKSGTESLTWQVTLTDGSTREGVTPVVVAAKTYPVQRLTLAPKYVTPDPALKERLERERRLMGQALATYSHERHWNLPMLRPVPGIITSWYGLRRVLNGQPRGAHRGLDFRAAAGDPIAAIADGTVVLTGDFYYAGQFAVIDHGLGVTSTYMHMSEIIAQEGQKITAGKTVGRIGSTGRSTGPHLHLSLSILGTGVDALPLLAMTPADKASYEKAFRDAAAKASGKASVADTKRKKPSAKTKKNPAARKAPPTKEKILLPQSGTKAARNAQ